MINKNDNIHAGIEKLAGAKRVLRIKKQIMKAGGWENASPELQDAFNRSAKKYHKRFWGKHRQLGLTDRSDNWLIRANVKAEKDYARRYAKRVGVNPWKRPADLAEIAGKATKAKPNWSRKRVPSTGEVMSGGDAIEEYTLRGKRVPNEKVDRYLRRRGL